MLRQYKEQLPAAIHTARISIAFQNVGNADGAVNLPAFERQADTAKQNSLRIFRHDC